MTRARETSRLVNSETFSVDSNNNVGLSSLTPDAKFDIVGVLSATSFSGDGSNLTNINSGATLSPSDGTQRLVVTSLTTGEMLEVATNSDLTYNTSTNTLSATQYSGTLLGNVTGLQGTPSITVQDITAEQISVAGTVSYGSVDNESSVGIITANKGIKVPDGGVVVTGVITATSFQGDGSGLLGVSGTQSFFASGNIPNGSPVIINTTNQVSVISGSNLTSENFIGIAAETISSGSEGLITVVGGVNNSQSGLTTAKKYYVQQNGTLGLTPDTPFVVAGTSLSSTRILIQKS